MAKQQYTFENFITAPSNQSAYAACRALSEETADYHPLLLCGPNGCGKSHLLFALKERLEAQNKRVCHTTGEALLYDLLSCLKQTKASFEFRRRYCRFSAVLIDNCQFLQGRIATQRELLLLAERMQREGRLLIMASDRAPEELGVLAQEIPTQFDRGLIAEISVPEPALRQEYLSRLCEARGICLSEKAIDTAVQRYAPNLPALKGFFNTICFCLGDTDLKEIDAPWLEKHIFCKEGIL